MKKPVLVLMTLLIFGFACSCNSTTKNGTHTSFEVSKEGNTYFRFFEMDGTSSDGHKYELNVFYGYSVNDGTGIVLNRKKAEIAHSYVTETVADYITVILSAKLSNEIVALKKAHSDLENSIIDDLHILNEAMEDRNIEVIKLDVTMRN